MTWFKVDDGLPDHRKVRRLGRDKLPAIGLWTLCGAWCSSNLMDGFVPDEIVRRWDASAKYAEKLVAAGLWHHAEHEGEPGYRFHQWSEPGRQPTKAQVEQERDAARERMRRIRAGRGSPDVRPNTASTNGRTASEVREAFGNPVPSRPVPSSSSSSPPPPEPRAVVASLGADDDETTKVLDLIQAECKPTALGPYVRTLAENGDLSLWLDRVRNGGKTTAAYDGPTHPFDPDPSGESCETCHLPRGHARHQTPQLRIVGEAL